MSKETLELAIIGPGGISGAHVKNINALGGAKVVAVAEVNEERRKAVCEQWGTRGYADFAELFKKEKSLDAIIVTTPPTVRAQVIAAAGKRKKKLPVFVEKPPAFTASDARKIVRNVSRTNVPTCVGFMYRYLPAVDYLKSLIAGKPLCMVQSVFACPALTIWNLPGWFKIKARSGGHIIDQSIHVMDLLRYIVGDIVEVHTLGGNTIIPKSETCDIEDSSSTNIRFASGVQGGHVHSWAHQSFFGEVTVYGKDFRLTLVLDSRVHGFIGQEKIDKTFDPQPAGLSHHYEEMKVFLNAVRSGDFSAIRSPYSDAAKTLFTVTSMAKSIETGKPVKVPQE